jgi:hypothetical protein
MAGYLVVHFVALAFARADLLPPLIAAWTANNHLHGDRRLAPAPRPT